MIISIRDFVTQINNPPSEWQGKDLYVMNAKTKQINSIVRIQKVNLKARQETQWAIDGESL